MAEAGSVARDLPWTSTHRQVDLKSKGFVGRPSLNLTVPELSMRESLAFWEDRRGGARVSTREIVDVLSVTGGVPKYLEGLAMRYA